MFSFKNIVATLTLSASVLLFASCTKSYDDPGLEFAPQMYVSKAYEPYVQVNGNLNKFNPMGLNMRTPAKNTIPRRNFSTSFVAGDSAGTKFRDIMAYNLEPGQAGLEYASANLKNPVPLTPQVLKEGEVLYVRYCAPCHGAQGDGAGKVGEKYAGVANYAGITENNGHIFHVITHGKGRMWPHGSQVNPEERWKIVHYVNKLQKDLKGDDAPKEEKKEDGGDKKEVAVK